MMSLLVRPRDCTRDNWQWTLTLYINRNIVLATHIDVSPFIEKGTNPKELTLYGFAEAFGYVQSLKLRTGGETDVRNLEIAFRPPKPKGNKQGSSVSVGGA
jgi:hypothetical protein